MSGKQIYFIRPVGQLGPIKIGCSKLPEGRLETLAIQSPLRLEIVAAVPGTHAHERRLHGMFAAHWLHHEWFGASKELLALLDYVVANQSLPALPEGKVVPLPRKKGCGAGAGGKRPPSKKVIALGAEVRADYEAGMSLPQIAEKTGKWPTVIRSALLAVGVTLRRYTPNPQRRGVHDKARAEEFRRRYLAGETLQVIGDKYGITRERVRQILRKTDVPSLGLRREHQQQPHPLTAAEIEAARLYAQGTPPNALILQFGLTHSQIAAAVRRCGYKAKGSGFWLTRHEVAEQVVSLYREGVGCTEIARRIPELGHATYVFRYLQRAGVEPRHKVGRRPITWDTTKQAGAATRTLIVDLHRQGLKPRQIAAKTGRNIGTVYGHLHGAGIWLGKQAAAA